MEEQPSGDDEVFSVGENLGEDLRDSVARHANRLFMNWRGRDAAIDLGEHGMTHIDDVRVWRATEPGKLIAFIRKETGDHKKEVVSVVIALGVVAAGLYNLKYRRK